MSNPFIAERSMSRRAINTDTLSLQQAAQSLRARGVPFAALVSAAARAGLGRRSLLATALTPVELEASNLARLRGSGREAYRRALQAEWRTATQRAFASGAKGGLVTTQSFNTISPAVATRCWSPVGLRLHSPAGQGSDSERAQVQGNADPIKMPGQTKRVI